MTLNESIVPIARALVCMCTVMPDCMWYMEICLQRREHHRAVGSGGGRCHSAPGVRHAGIVSLLVISVAKGQYPLCLPSPTNCARVNIILERSNHK
jgi:hypothetical protein